MLLDCFGKKYSLEEKLGEGNFGAVYLATKRGCEEKFAIKKIKNYDSNDSNNEVTILETVQHKHIIKYIESYSPKRGRLMIVMEYADAGTLEFCVKNKSLIAEEFNVWRIIAQLSGALKYLHELKPQHIMHRDLKPANVLGVNVRNESNGVYEIHLKIADFGLAKLLHKSAQKNYYTNTVVGTPIYMAPEVLKDFQSYSFPADVWSLGALLVFTCNRHHLFTSRKAITGWTFSDPLSGDYSEDLKGLVSRMLHPDYHERPKTDEIWKEALKDNRQKLEP